MRAPGNARADHADPSSNAGASTTAARFTPRLPPEVALTKKLVSYIIFM
jgi:hypothetical protein